MPSWRRSQIRFHRSTSISWPCCRTDRFVGTLGIICVRCSARNFPSKGPGRLSASHAALVTIASGVRLRLRLPKNPIHLPTIFQRRLVQLDVATSHKSNHLSLRSSSLSSSNMSNMKTSSLRKSLSSIASLRFYVPRELPRYSQARLISLQHAYQRCVGVV